MDEGFWRAAASGSVRGKKKRRRQTLPRSATRKRLRKAGAASRWLKQLILVPDCLSVAKANAMLMHRREFGMSADGSATRPGFGRCGHVLSDASVGRRVQGQTAAAATRMRQTLRRRLRRCLQRKTSPT